MRPHLFAVLFAAACGSGGSTKTLTSPGAPTTALDLKLGVTALRGEKSWAIQQNEVLQRCDELELHIDIDQPAYVYVVQFLPGGTPQVLFPEKPADRMMKPGTKIRIPDEGSFQIVGTGGENVVYVLMSRDPIDKVDTALAGSITNIRTTTDTTPALGCDQQPDGKPPAPDPVGTGSGTVKPPDPVVKPPRVGGGESRDKFLSKLKSRGDFNARQLKLIKRPNAGSVVHVTAKNASDTLLVADFTFKHTE